MEQKFGENTLIKGDAVDFVYAGIGGVDAIQNCIDFIHLNPTKKAIVVTTDFAQNDLNLTGEALDASNKKFLVTEDVAEYQNKVKETSKSEVYKKFVFEKLMPAEIALSLIGNLYVGFILQTF